MVESWERSRGGVVVVVKDPDAPAAGRQLQGQDHGWSTRGSRRGRRTVQNQGMWKARLARKM